MTEMGLSFDLQEILGNKGSLKDACSHKQKELSREIELNVHSVSDLGACHFSNVYKNLLSLPNSKNFILAKGKAKNIPAIICGAGVSIEKDLPLLSNLHKSALVFAGGTAMAVFNKHRAFFHFGGGVDKLSPYSLCQEAIQIPKPFFCTTAFASQSFVAIPANKILVGDDAEFPYQGYLEQELGLCLPKIDCGYNVTCFLLSCAQFLGCSPIVLLGVDLCYDKNKYASQIQGEPNEKYGILKTKNQKGKEVFTQNDWLVVKKWIEDFQTAHPETPIINASEGLFLEGLKHQKLSNASFLSKQIDDRDLFSAIALSSGPVEISTLKTKAFFRKVKKDIEDCQKTAETMGKERDTCNLQKLDRLLQKNGFYQLLVLPLWQIWEPLLQEKFPVMASSKEVHRAQKIAFILNVTKRHLVVLREATETM